MSWSPWNWPHYRWNHFFWEKLLALLSWPGFLLVQTFLSGKKKKKKHNTVKRRKPYSKNAKNVWVYESWDREFLNLSFPNVIFIKKKETPLLRACIYNSLNYLLKKFSFHFLMWSHFEYLFLSLSALFSHTHAAAGRIPTGPANTPGYYTLCTFEEWRL